MNINVVFKTIAEALEENLETIILMLIVVSSLYAVNILFGTIIGSFKEKFNSKKFFFGILKGLLANIGIFALCYILNLFSLTLQLTKDITIRADFISSLEIGMILIVWAIDLIKDIVEKLKSMKKLKYVTYEDVQINAQSNKELG